MTIYNKGAKPMTTKTAKTTLTPLVVTTAHKGVFFGYGDKNAKTEIRLEKARMCVYWSTDVKGVLGLAAIGPNNSCKVGLAVPAITLQGVTSIMECSEEAIAAWEKAPWA